jgi:hypothetical protein
MSSERAIVRASIISALSDASAGISARYDSIRGEFGLPEIEPLDFGEDSRNVLQCYVANANDVDISQVADYPALAIYTSAVSNRNIEKGRAFSGAVTAHVDIYLRHQARRGELDGAPIGDIERYADAIEAAMLRCLSCYLGWPSGVVYNNEFSVSREPVLALGDGWQQRIAAEFYFEVHL